MQTVNPKNMSEERLFDIILELRRYRIGLSDKVPSSVGLNPLKPGVDKPLKGRKHNRQNINNKKDSKWLL